LTDFPTVFFTLPKLAWLAFEGNPFSTLHSNQTENILPYINWEEIELKEQLGEGASGIISKGNFKQSQKEIAIKTFSPNWYGLAFPKISLPSAIMFGAGPTSSLLTSSSGYLVSNSTGTGAFVLTNYNLSTTGSKTFQKDRSSRLSLSVLDFFLYDFPIFHSLFFYLAFDLYLLFFD
jgi:hypothetical protein